MMIVGEFAEVLRERKRGGNDGGVGLPSIPLRPRPHALHLHRRDVPGKHAVRGGGRIRGIIPRGRARGARGGREGGGVRREEGLPQATATGSLSIVAAVSGGGVGPSECGGVLKPGIAFFGETLDGRVARTFEADRQRSNAVVVIGTSLSV